MKNVKVRANGAQFADVALSSGNFSDRAITPTAFDLDAHQQHTTGIYRGKAKQATGGRTAIVTAQIESWDASLHHILVDHSGHGEAEGKLETQILRD